MPTNLVSAMDQFEKALFLMGFMGVSGKELAGTWDIAIRHPQMKSQCLSVLWAILYDRERCRGSQFSDSFLLSLSFVAAVEEA